MNINWGKLKSQDRVKDIGRPWSFKELNALHNLKIPACYVRGGILTTEDYKKTLLLEKKEGKNLKMLSSAELSNYAARLGIDIIDEMSIVAIRELIREVMEENDLHTLDDIKAFERKRLEKLDKEIAEIKGDEENETVKEDVDSIDEDESEGDAEDNEEEKIEEDDEEDEEDDAEEDDEEDDEESTSEDYKESSSETAKKRRAKRRKKRKKKK